LADRLLVVGWAKRGVVASVLAPMGLIPGETCLDDCPGRVGVGVVLSSMDSVPIGVVGSLPKPDLTGVFFTPGLVSTGILRRGEAGNRIDLSGLPGDCIPIIKPEGRDVLVNMVGEGVDSASDRDGMRDRAAGGGCYNSQSLALATGMA
jgi:hypothetical protein